MRFSRRLACLTALAAFAVVAGPASAGAATHVVDDDAMAAVGDCGAVTPAFPTISLAVTAASSGDTIEVCPGTYSEGVLVDKSLTINGPNAGTSGLDPRGPEATVSSGATTMLVTATDVAIDGFTVTGDFGIYVGGPSDSGTEILNNIVSGTSRALSFDGPGTGIDVVGNELSSPVRQLHLAGSPFSDFVLNENRFSGAGTIFYSGNGSIAGYEFKDNEVLNSSNNMAARISNGDVSGNTFESSVAGSLTLQIDLHESTVTGNTWDGNETSRCLQLYGVQFGLDPSENVLVSQNTFTDCGGPAAPAGSQWALQLSEGIDQISIANNDFVSTTGDAINTRGTGWTLNPEIFVNQNNITGSTGLGVNNTAMGTLDAECNWWGAADGPGPVGPGTGDGVSTNVDFAPWLVAPAPGGLCIGPLPMDRKEAVRDSLAAKQGSASAKDAKEIGKAIEHINRSLDPDLWADDTHLDPKKGHKVFDEEKNAVGHLDKVTSVDVSPEIAELVDIDHDLAQTAIDDAQAGCANAKCQKEIDKANEDMAKGDADATAGKPKQAIDHYKHAWEHAQKAIKES